MSKINFEISEAVGLFKFHFTAAMISNSRSMNNWSSIRGLSMIFYNSRYSRQNRSSVLIAKLIAAITLS